MTFAWRWGQAASVGVSVVFSVGYPSPPFATGAPAFGSDDQLKRFFSISYPAPVLAQAPHRAGAGREDKSSANKDCSDSNPAGRPWTKKFGCTKAQLKQAINKVGPASGAGRAKLGLNGPLRPQQQSSPAYGAAFANLSPLFLW